jgi:hypothetical protein
MYNFRYHIASLVAVFLALSIGLLLGTIVVERGTLNAQRTTLVDSLQKEYTTLRTDNTTLKAQLDTNTAFVADAAPVLIDSRLAGRTVMVLTNAGRADAAAAVSDAVAKAGGAAVTATFRDVGFGLKDKTLAAKVAAVLATDANADLTAPVADALAREFSDAPGTPSPVTDVLVAAGELSMNTPDGSGTPALIVTTGSFDDKPDAAEISLATAGKAHGLIAAGAETTKRATGVAAAAADAGLPSVDDADTPVGQVSLVWVLLGRATGRYGAAKGVDAAYPSPLAAATAK